MTFWSDSSDQSSQSGQNRKNLPSLGQKNKQIGRQEGSITREKVIKLKWTNQGGASMNW